MPKAVRFYELGGPEVLKIEEVPLRQPRQGEVVVDVAAITPCASGNTSVPRSPLPYMAERSSYCSQPLLRSVAEDLLPGQADTGCLVRFALLTPMCFFFTGTNQAGTLRRLPYAS
jgi:hypothetical protein